MPAGYRVFFYELRERWLQKSLKKNTGALDDLPPCIRKLPCPKLFLSRRFAPGCMMRTGFYLRNHFSLNHVITERAGSDPGQIPLYHQALRVRSTFGMDVLVTVVSFTELL
jgi:hypothetical protein